MKRRTVQISIRVDNELREKVEAIKKEDYGRLTIVLENAIRDYQPKQHLIPR